MIGHILWLLASFIVILGGFFVTFAGGMSAVPNDRMGKHGCVASLVGLVLLVLCIADWVL
jgi:hypothetical protein